MSKQTFYKNFRDLEELEIVKPSRKIGRAIMYRINMEHPLVKRLNEIVNEVSLQIAKKEAKKMHVPAKTIEKRKEIFLNALEHEDAAIKQIMKIVKAGIIIIEFDENRINPNSKYVEIEVLIAKVHRKENVQ